MQGSVDGARQALVIKTGEVFGGQWLAEEETLCAVAVLFAQGIELLARLDAFAYHFYVKQVGEGDDCRGNARILPIGRQIANSWPLSARSAVF